MVNTHEELARLSYNPDRAEHYDILLLEAHKRIEQRISKLEQPVLGMKGGVDRQQVLQIIEEEFGKLDHI